MNTESGFEKCMNRPEPHNGKAYIQYDNKTRQFWARCPHCGKKAFPVSEGAVIKNQEFKCRGSNCKKMFLVDTGEV